ncbi:hypothetical protein RIF29_01913 [Crotalaria pallida]|uniref:Uncharacterized protein n=1 Tax=Crotalaria pallida TaxID=3830 RepID=A0AAN9P8Q9_CROPI
MEAPQPNKTPAVAWVKKKKSRLASQRSPILEENLVTVGKDIVQDEACASEQIVSKQMPSILNPGHSDTVYMLEGGAQSSMRLIRKSSVRFQFSEEEKDETTAGSDTVTTAPELHEGQEGRDLGEKEEEGLCTAKT